MKYELNENERLDDLGINNLKIIQNTKYFCFGIDSVLLANFVKSSKENDIILDLCSGSGVIPIITSAKLKVKNHLAVEIQKEMYDLLKRNIELNKLEEKINILNENVVNVKNIRKKILELYSKDNVQIITVNPPYKMCGTGINNDNSVKHIARNEVMCTLEDIFNTSSKLLNDGGKLYMVHKPERLTDLLTLSRKYNLEAKKLRLVYPRINSKPSILLIEYVKNGGNEIKILEPLYEYTENGDYTEEIYKMYGWKNLESR